MDQLERIPTPIGQRLSRARVGALPLLIWMAASLLAVRLWLAGPSGACFVGLAQGAEIQIDSPADGRLESLLVELYESVGAGDVLATLDATGLDARLSTALAELERLQAELSAARAGLEAGLRETLSAQDRSLSLASLELPAELRAFNTDEAALELKILETRLAITASELEEDRVEVRLQRARRLAEEGLGPRVDVDDLERLIALESARTEDLKLLEAGQKAKLEQARERQQALLRNYLPLPTMGFAQAELEARLAGLKAAIAVQRKRLEELGLQREGYFLRAPASGRVAALTASEGQFLLAGDPICALQDWQADEVALWVPEASAPAPRIGDRLLVKRAGSSSESPAAEGIVLAMSPRLEPLPQRLWRDTRVAEYGRACRVGPVAALGLVPGERVRLDPLPEAP